MRASRAKNLPIVISIIRMGSERSYCSRVATGVMAMTGNRKVLMFVASALLALGTVALAYPRPISAPVLGDGWQCHATALHTSCTKVQPAAPIVHSLGIAPISGRRA